ncbi:cobalt-factor III C(17)-methyltransferase [Metallosphaera tengchongensis]|uniref:Cobalt-factor III C(17)-methyltransferase n=2 Tax=Metallosphaera tengchongensis TaxID=1532350 RepID=A0A6N0NVW6_9CREN|nr:cobalt-factor III C(17)-methyltransferase [Metallosphaera tengchongensis]
MIKVVGIGSGGDTITLRALKELQEADIVIGYRGYIDMIREFIRKDAVVLETEVDEIDVRIEQARSHKDRRTIVVSSGDPMIFGMGSKLYKEADEIIPGITALSLAGSVAKIPLDDSAIISASTYSIPLDSVLKRIELAIEANFTIGIYNINPSTRKNDAITIERKIREKAIGWTYYIIHNAMKEGQHVETGTVERLDITRMTMNSILILKR